MASVTTTFYNLLRETLGVVPPKEKDAAKAAAEAAKLRALDSKLLEAAYSVVPEVRALRSCVLLWPCPPAVKGAHEEGCGPVSVCDQRFRGDACIMYWVGLGGVGWCM